MILINTGEIYYNTRLYFREKYIDDLPNDLESWSRAYRAWLAEQGGEIIMDKEFDYIRDGLGVAINYDKFGFNDPGDAMKFVLRWA